jgi:hypothetical protein
MKKINHIYQLKAKKEWIKKHEASLEDTMRDQWYELKETLKPGNLAREAYGNMVEKKVHDNLENDSVLKNTIVYAGTLWAKKFADKAQDKIDRLFVKRSGS